MSARQPPVLSSLQNPQVKQMVRLRQARERRRSGLTRVDGGRELLRALEAGLVPATVYTCESRVRGVEAKLAIEAAMAAGARRQEVSEPVYAKIQYGDRDEGLCAPLAWNPRGLGALRPAGSWFLVALEGVEKPGNFGAVLRSADAAGADALVLCDPVLDPANPNAVRASMGTIFTVPVAVTRREPFLEFLRERGIAAHAAVVDARRPYTDADLTRPAALILGSERAGLSSPWRDPPHQPVSIPMAGHADSLNLAAAAAVLLFEVVRQRRASSG